MRSDHDIFQTFEGDNTVLLQQVGLHCAATVTVTFTVTAACWFLSSKRPAWAKPEGIHDQVQGALECEAMQHVLQLQLRLSCFARVCR
jgi:hypothetical protein